MEVRDYWRKIVHRDACRIYIANKKKFIFDSDFVPNDQRRDIFAIAEDVQPVFVIDNTQLGGQERHAVLESDLYSTEDGVNTIKLGFNTAVIGKGEGEVVLSSNVIVKFYSDEKRLIGQEKIVDKIGFLIGHLILKVGSFQLIPISLFLCL